MCEVKPGPRCASDTLLAAAEAAMSYNGSYPSGPDVHSLAASESIGMLHARAQVAQRRWRRTHEAIGAEFAAGSPDADRLATLQADARRHLTDYQVAQDALKETWERKDTRVEQDAAIVEQIEQDEKRLPVETFDEDGYSTCDGLHKDTRLDRDGFNAAGFKPEMRESADGPVTVYTHRDTGTAYGPDGFDRYGLNAAGIDRRGFDSRTGLHTVTKRKLGPDGRSIGGYDRRGFDELGYHEVTGTLYNEAGFTMDGQKVAPVQRTTLLDEPVGSDVA